MMTAFMVFWRGVRSVSLIPYTAGYIGRQISICSLVYRSGFLEFVKGFDQSLVFVGLSNIIVQGHRVEQAVVQRWTVCPSQGLLLSAHEALPCKDEGYLYVSCSVFHGVLGCDHPGCIVVYGMRRGRSFVIFREGLKWMLRSRNMSDFSWCRQDYTLISNLTSVRLGRFRRREYLQLLASSCNAS